MPNVMKIWEPKTSWNPLGHTGPVTGLLYLYSNCLFCLSSLCLSENTVCLKYKDCFFRSQTVPCAEMPLSQHWQPSLGGLNAQFLEKRGSWSVTQTRVICNPQGDAVQNTSLNELK